MRPATNAFRDACKLLSLIAWAILFVCVAPHSTLASGNQLASEQSFSTRVDPGKGLVFPRDAVTAQAAIKARKSLFEPPAIFPHSDGMAFIAQTCVLFSSAAVIHLTPFDSLYVDPPHRWQSRAPPHAS